MGLNYHWGISHMILDETVAVTQIQLGTYIGTIKASVNMQ